LPAAASKPKLLTMLKAIVFDFDGVLVDSEPLHFQAFAQVARTIGFHFDYQRYLADFVGFDDRDSFRHMLTELGKPADEQRIADLCARKQDAFADLARRGVPTIPGAIELVHEAAAKMPIAIASGATALDIDLIIRGLRLRDCFEVIVAADHVRQSKPHPQTYALAVEQLAARHNGLDLTAAHCLAIEDTAFGIQSARAAGLLTLGLATTGPAENLHQAHRVEPSLAGVSLSQLHHWFDQI
jgi:HAD superfamily hydrolase (TIGR01509 family)